MCVSPAEFLVLEADLRSSGGALLHLLETECQGLLQSIVLLSQVYGVWWCTVHSVRRNGEGEEGEGEDGEEEKEQNNVAVTNLHLQCKYEYMMHRISAKL